MSHQIPTIELEPAWHEAVWIDVLPFIGSDLDNHAIGWQQYKFNNMSEALEWIAHHTRKPDQFEWAHIYDNTNKKIVTFYQE